MKKLLMAVLLVVSVSAPTLAMDHPHGVDPEKCKKECQMLLRNCTQEALSIQEQISRLQKEVGKGSDEYTVEELRKLDQKLKEVNANLKALQSPR
jgi:peptidoglycan hydrolase CwlO-like protein